MVEFDLEPFYETARLLYEGPWVAERYLVIRNLLASSPDSIHPVTREITAAGARLTAADTFAALYRLQALRRIAERAFDNIDALVLPTAPTVYSTAQVLANPIELNSRLGTYTNFVNLLDLCGLALPAAMRPDGIPFGITLLAPAGQDAAARQHRPRLPCRHQADDRAPRGWRSRRSRRCRRARTTTKSPIAVVGAHLSGMALNGELKSLGGRLLEADDDRAGLQALRARHHAAETGHAARRSRQGIADRTRGLGAVAVRVRQIRRRDPAAAVDRHRSVWPTAAASRDFSSNPPTIDGARDISSFGGWRAYMAEAAAV